MSKLLKLDVNIKYDITVIGAGPAAVSAAIYGARKGLKVAMIGDLVGGQLINTNDIENIIGTPLTNGFDFSQSLEKHLNEYEIAFYKGHKVKKVIKESKDSVLILDDELEVKSKTVIVATGAIWKKLGIDGEDKYAGKGVHYCATCDGPFYRNKDVVIIGGGNSGVEAAIDLSNIAKTITLVEYSSTINADEVLRNKLNGLKNVKVLTSSAAQSITGNLFAEGLKILNRDSNVVEEIKTDGIFVEIGTVANTSFVSDILDINSNHEIKINSVNKTSVEGIFAAGDCTDTKYKQVIIAMGEGAKAALSAYEYLIKEY
jgi:FAD-dependent pyridine nucleotide-disulphide oxidoreductase